MKKKKRARQPKPREKLGPIISIQVSVSDPKSASSDPKTAAFEPNVEHEPISIKTTTKRSKLAVRKPPKSNLSLIPFENQENPTRVLELGQIWACPNDSGIYARIDQIFPTESLLKVTPLLPHPISPEEIIFSEHGLPLSCGVFKPSDTACFKKIDDLVYNVGVEYEEKKGGGGGMYRVFPKKGEVWAIYVKWDGKAKMFEHKLVEVVSDFEERDGVSAFALAGVKGSDGLYKREVFEGFHLVRNFSRRFMPMFSHRVPAAKSGDGGGGGEEVMWRVE